MSLRTVALSAVLGCGLLFAAGVAPARAQHLVTDNEAGKLTLDALTATPAPVYRPMYRALYRPAMAMRRAHRPGYVGRMMHTSSLVAFRRHVASHRRHR